MTLKTFLHLNIMTLMKSIALKYAPPPKKIAIPVPYK